MGLGIDKIWQMIGNQKESNKPTHAKATVLRKDNEGVIWVQIEGGVDETPVYSSTANVKPNDVVTVKVAGGKVYIEGSTSSPSVGVTEFGDTINIVNKNMGKVDEKADKAVGDSEAALAAAKSAEEAADVAKVTGQHFWVNDDEPETYGGTGAHVTEQEKGDWVEAIRRRFPDLSDDKPYHNILMNSLGILLRTALNNLVSITRSSIAFFDGLGNNASNVVASFGKDGAQVGTSNSHNLKLSSNSMGIYYGKDRLATFASDADKTEVHLGGSDKAPNVKYSNQEVEDAYEFIRTCHVSDGKIYDSDNNLTPYTLMFFSDTSYHVLDEDMEEFSSGQYDCIYYSVIDEVFYKAIVLSPQTEIPANVGIDVSAFRAEVDKDAIIVKFANDEEFRAIFGSNGAFSSGYGTVAKPYGQTAIGRYNVEDDSNTYALIIGNGTADDARHNVLAVEWERGLAFWAKKSSTPSSQVPASTEYGQGGGVYCYDSDGFETFYSEMCSKSASDPDKASTLYRSYVVRRNVNGSGVTEGLYIGIDNNGNRKVWTITQEPWLEGLGVRRFIQGDGTTWTALNLQNGNIIYKLQQNHNGDLVRYKSTDNGVTWRGDRLYNAEGGGMVLRVENVDRDAANPSSDQWWTVPLTIRDSSGEELGLVTGVRRTDGSMEMGIWVRNEGSGTQYTNNFSVGVKKDGSQYYNVPAPNKFRSAIAEYGSANATLNSTYTSGGQIECIRKGNVIFFNINALALKQYSGRQQVATIPAGYRPAHTVYANFNIPNASTVLGYIIFYANGVVNVDGGAARTVWGSGCGIRA